MADGSDRLAVVIKSLYQGNRMWVFGQVPHRTVAAGIEDRVVIRGFDLHKPQGLCQHSLGCGILFEPSREIGLALRRVAFRIQRRLSPFG